MGKRNRQRRNARADSYREHKPIILIVTEGAITEPNYLRGFAAWHRNPRVDIRVEPDAGVPKTTVETAKEIKNQAEKKAKGEEDDNARFDEVWCVFDVDEHPNLSDAVQMARDNGIRLAMSNPCFELWLWLHFAEQPGMRHRHDLQRMMRQHIANYDKHVNYSEYEEGYDKAVVRAKQLEEMAKEANEEGRNPTTGVWQLTESIRTH